MGGVDDAWEPGANYAALVEDRSPLGRAGRNLARRIALLERVAEAAREKVDRDRHHLWPSGARRTCDCALCQALDRAGLWSAC